MNCAAPRSAPLCLGQWVDCGSGFASRHWEDDADRLVAVCTVRKLAAWVSPLAADPRRPACRALACFGDRRMAGREAPSHRRPVCGVDGRRFSASSLSFGVAPSRREQPQVLRTFHLRRRCCLKSSLICREVLDTPHAPLTRSGRSSARWRWRNKARCLIGRTSTGEAGYLRT